MTMSSPSSKEISDFQDISPVDGSCIGSFQCASPSEVDAVMIAAREAQGVWGAKSLKERLQALQKLSDLVLEQSDHIAEAITRSTGKPIVESYLSEWQAVIGVIDYFVRKAPHILKSEKRTLSILWNWPKRSSTIEYRPVGVVGIISPWNYPFCIPMGDLIAALAAGCTVVLKPSELVPAVGALIADLCREANLPVWVVQGKGDVGQALIDARPNKIVFTGGPETGQRVMTAASKHLIPVLMELGGKDPMLVLEDACIEQAASAAVWGCFTNSGQVCASVKRVYVHESVADAFISRVHAKVAELRIGDPMNPETEIGSMINADQAALMRGVVQEAVLEGARVLCGGTHPEGFSEAYFQPTVLTEVSQSMRVAHEEVFGPILPIIRVKTEEEAIRCANDSEFGLCASVFSRSRGENVARRIHTGTVMINDCTYTHGLPETPWGGVGRSGFGRIHGAEGLREFVYSFHVNRNHDYRRRSLWWFPYDGAHITLGKAIAQFVGTSRKLGAVGKMVKAGILDRVRRIDK